MKKFFVIMSVLLMSAPVYSMLETLENKEDFQKRVTASVCDRLQNNNSTIKREEIKNIVALTLDMDQERRDADNRSEQEFQQKVERTSNTAVFVCAGGITIIAIACILAGFITYGAVYYSNQNNNSTSIF